MLRSLAVRSFAIIDSLDLEFQPGLNVLTGETGAGKSIIMQALNLILGGRASAEMIRSGAEKATVDAVFDIAGSAELLALIEEMGFAAEENLLLLSRDVSTGGKSACRVAGRPSTVAQLKEIGDWLVDLHGQHEHQSLLTVARHLEFLDAWAGAGARALRSQVAAQYVGLQQLNAERQATDMSVRERAQALDLLRFQSDEITTAALFSGEEELLNQELSRLTNARRLAEAASAAAASIGGGDDGGAGVALAAAVKLLEDAAGIDPSLQPILETVRSAGYELSEAERDLVRYAGSVEQDDERQALIQERLEVIRSLRRKYGDTIEDILEFGQQVAGRLSLLEEGEERSGRLQAEIEAAERSLAELTRRLTACRRSAAAEFASVVHAELQGLAMSKSRFEVSIEPESITPRGADRVEFLFAANTGEPLRPLAKVASGGELSRLTLAIKTALARQDALPTMVFDEIDAGVGGRTAAVIGSKLEGLASSAQVLCITHLAQIASRGDSHYRIEKREQGGRSVVSVCGVSGEERVAEIARMIGGVEVTEAVRLHAREMLDE